MVHYTAGFSFKKVGQALDLAAELIREARRAGEETIRASSMNSRERHLHSLIHAIMAPGAERARDAAEVYLLRSGEMFEIDQEASTDRVVCLKIVPAA